MDFLKDAKYRVKAALDNRQATRDVRAASRYDARRFLSYSSSLVPVLDQQNLAARITERYHAVEKGLSLPEPRPGFGIAPVGAVLRLTERYVSRYGKDDVVEAAYGALSAYVAFNQAAGLSNEDIPHFNAIKTALGAETTRSGGTIEITRDEVLEAVKGVDLDFFTARHSTRQFTDAPVSLEDLEFAARAGATAPAVCNREFSQVQVWRNRSDIDRLLAIQGGARGFADGIPCLAMITVSLRNYWDAAERNQAWIDGGLFAMNFMLGLHSRGLGSVPLNWAKPPSKNREMLEAAGLSEDTAIIMLIGIGNLRGNYRVAASPRVQNPLILRD